MAVPTPQIAQADISTAIEPQSVVDSGIGEAFGKLSQAAVDVKRQNQIDRATANFEVQRAAFQNTVGGAEMPDFELSERSKELLGGQAAAFKAIMDARGSGMIDERRAHTMAEKELRRMIAQSPGLADEFIDAANRVGLRPVGAGFREAAAARQQELASVAALEKQQDASIDETAKWLEANNYSGQAQILRMAKAQGREVALEELSRINRDITPAVQQEQSLARQLAEADATNNLSTANARRIGRENSTKLASNVITSVESQLRAAATQDPKLAKVLEEFQEGVAGDRREYSDEVRPVINELLLAEVENERARFLNTIRAVPAGAEREALMAEFEARITPLVQIGTGELEANLLEAEKQAADNAVIANMPPELKRTAATLKFVSKDLGIDIPFSASAEILRYMDSLKGADLSRGQLNALSQESLKLAKENGMKQSANNAIAAMLNIPAETFNALPEEQQIGLITDARSVGMNLIASAGTPEEVLNSVKGIANMIQLSEGAGGGFDKADVGSVVEATNGHLRAAAKQAFSEATSAGVALEFDSLGRMNVPRAGRTGDRAKTRVISRVKEIARHYNNYLDAVDLVQDTYLGKIPDEAGDISKEFVQARIGTLQAAQQDFLSTAVQGGGRTPKKPSKGSKTYKTLDDQIKTLQGMLGEEEQGEGDAG
jgi:hypothetical protein